MPVTALDNSVASWLETVWNRPVGLLLSGTPIALIFAYLVRFLAVSLNTVEAGLAKIRPSLDDAARSLGHGPTATLRQIHAPLLGGSLLTAAVLVFVDVMKELPATMVMRPLQLRHPGGAGLSIRFR
jgi:iron(III) transport system permease protein